MMQAYAYRRTSYRSAAPTVPLRELMGRHGPAHEILQSHRPGLYDTDSGSCSSESGRLSGP